MKKKKQKKNTVKKQAEKTSVRTARKAVQKSVQKPARRRTEESAKKPSFKGEIIGLIACVPFLLFGAAFIFVGLKEISFTRRCSAETQGVITEVTKSRTYKDKNNRQKTEYKATYSYEIDGKELIGHFLTVTPMKSGKTVKVRYKPDDPQQKYVKGYESAGNVLILIVGIVWDGIFLLIAYCLIISCRHKIKAKKKEKIDLSKQPD